MSVARITNVSMWCDHVDGTGLACSASRVSGVDNFAESRAEAHRDGWTHDPIDKLDWCPAHRAEAMAYVDMKSREGSK